MATLPAAMMQGAARCTVRICQLRPGSAPVCTYPRQVARNTASQDVTLGPQEPNPKRKPEWVRILEEDAEVDEDVAAVLKGTGGDPDRIRANMRAALQARDNRALTDMLGQRQGQEDPPSITFREVQPFALWVWLEFADGPPSRRELELLESTLKAWFMVGKLGGYNSQNLQVFYSAGGDELSFMSYDAQEAEQSQGSYLHDVSEVEARGPWVRFRVDMGTCDELSLDVLLNMLIGYSQDFAGLKHVYVGGANADWPVPEEGDEDEEELLGLDDDEDDEGTEVDPDERIARLLTGKRGGGRKRRGAGARGADPFEFTGEGRPSMNPMSLPRGLEEEMDLLGEIQSEALLDQQPPGVGPQPPQPAPSREASSASLGSAAAAAAAGAGAAVAGVVAGSSSGVHARTAGGVAAVSHDVLQGRSSSPGVQGSKATGGPAASSSSSSALSQPQQQQQWGSGLMRWYTAEQVGERARQALQQSSSSSASDGGAPVSPGAGASRREGSAGDKQQAGSGATKQGSPAPTARAAKGSAGRRRAGSSGRAGSSKPKAGSSRQEGQQQQQQG